jgi:hypothetical protein
MKEPFPRRGFVPTDFRDGKTYPRRGREKLGPALWLARIFDKARATTDGTQDGYKYPCPMDRAVLSRWGVSPAEFTTAAQNSSSDDQILLWLAQHVSDANIEKANRWVGWQRLALDSQDTEEGVPGAWMSFVIGTLQWAFVVALAVIALSYLRDVIAHALQ